jgi:hypothetical protein
VERAWLPCNSWGSSPLLRMIFKPTALDGCPRLSRIEATRRRMFSQPFSRRRWKTYQKII